MSRKLRIDYPGAWHHVFNRGLAKRVMFENADDVARFLGLIAEAVSRGMIEVHAYCVLMTHFHLLVRSPRGELSKAMQWIENQYVRWFNRSRRRDGPLVRTRFGSLLIEDSVYWENVVRYIDQNAVEAHLCALPSEYPYASAFAYGRGGGPEWLSRDLVEAMVCEARDVPELDGDVYDSWVMHVPFETVRELVHRRRRCRGPVLRYDDLLRESSLRQQAWMRFKARLADGTALGAVVLVPATVRKLVDGCRRARPDRRSALRARPGSYWEVLEAGLLRDLCVLGHRELAETLGVSESTASRRHRRHGELCRRDPDHRALVSRIARRAIALDLPPPRRALDVPVRLAALEARNEERAVPAGELCARGVVGGG